MDPTLAQITKQQGKSYLLASTQQNWNRLAYQYIPCDQNPSNYNYVIKGKKYMYTISLISSVSEITFEFSCCTSSVYCNKINIINLTIHQHGQERAKFCWLPCNGKHWKQTMDRWATTWQRSLNGESPCQTITLGPRARGTVWAARSPHGRVEPRTGLGQGFTPTADGATQGEGHIGVVPFLQSSRPPT